MNESLVLDDFDMACPICFQEFEETGNQMPKLLICLHTYCSTCIDAITRHNLIICSICRKVHDRNKSEIMDNYMIHDYLRKQQIKIDEQLANDLKTQPD